MIIFGGMMIGAMLAGQKPTGNVFPVREWVGKDDYVAGDYGISHVEPRTGMEFVWVEGGCFKMGCIDGSFYCNPDEYPVHEVCLDGYWIGRYPVTQRQWVGIIEENPSYFRGNPDNPVENVSWHEARKYIAGLNASETREVFRLPTEAEWEYACRGIKKTMNFAGSMDPEEVAWHRGNSGGSTRPVGLRMPNELGLFDMSGNVYEWVRDVYDGLAYGRHNRHNPVADTGLGPSHDRYLAIIEPFIGSDSFRVIRGGSWQHLPMDARCSSRQSMIAGNRKSYAGFRIAADLPGPQNTKK